MSVNKQTITGVNETYGNLRLSQCTIPKSE